MWGNYQRDKNKKLSVFFNEKERKKERKKQQHKKKKQQKKNKTRNQTIHTLKEITI